MPPEPLHCSACGAVVHDNGATVYTAAGDLICLPCGALEQGAQARERTAGNRRELRVAAAAVVPAIVTFAAFVYAKHDEHYVYEGTSVDASWAVLRAGLGIALVAGFVGLFVGVLVVYRKTTK